ncbi:TetR/AcrR family transcriptional regulator [Pseudactinotalea suaedae]|uniref:TetR/AcrR family transcriptional regulator n=1 Tax=Pseudactinotalea suaedae TaxID=1524924 RepID=UPI0012E1C07A|nr:TetR family transcriptional regulator [Pseudactinotalea suaedae]
MPRIQAPTVAEHHQRQRRALIEAAMGLLAETAETPSMAIVGQRAGLARSSVYQYFASADELMAAVVADLFPDWVRQVLSRVEAAATPEDRVWAYIEANVDLFTSSAQEVARALTRVVGPDVLQGPMQEFHEQLQVPLQEALRASGEPEPEAMAALIDTVLVHALRGHDDSSGEDPAAVRDRALARLRRLLGGYPRSAAPELG